MNESNSISSQVQQLIAEIKKYFTLQKDLFKVEGVEKLSILLSASLLLVILLILGAGALFYLMFALAYGLEPYVGGVSISFCIIGGLFILLGIIVILLRNKLIINPIVKFLSTLFLQDK